ncbi:MAG: hypothetical protein ACR2NB_04080 [Solirubrobacteraceae bacterium]
MIRGGVVIVVRDDGTAGGDRLDPRQRLPVDRVEALPPPAATPPSPRPSPPSRSAAMSPWIARRASSSRTWRLIDAASRSAICSTRSVSIIPSIRTRRLPSLSTSLRRRSTRSSTSRHAAQSPAPFAMACSTLVKASRTRSGFLVFWAARRPSHAVRSAAQVAPASPVSTRPSTSAIRASTVARSTERSSSSGSAIATW